jgi:hypothetical protein
MESVGDLEGDGNTAARQPQHNGVSGTQVFSKFFAKHLRQRDASLPPVLKDDDHLPPFLHDCSPESRDLQRISRNFCDMPAYPRRSQAARARFHS